MESGPAGQADFGAWHEVTGAVRAATRLQRQFRKRKQEKEQRQKELLLSVALRLQRWTRGNIARNKLAAQEAARDEARLLERERVLAVFRQDLQRGEAEPHGGKLATILRAVSRLRRRKGDTAATGASDATEPVGAAAEPGEDGVQPQPQPPTAPGTRWQQPRDGGVDQALWWCDVVASLRRLRADVDSDKDEVPARRAQLRKLQQSLKQRRDKDAALTARMCQITDESLRLKAEMAQSRDGVRDPAKEARLRKLDDQLIAARAERRVAARAVKAEQRETTRAAAADVAATSAEGQRQSWLCQVTEALRADRSEDATAAAPEVDKPGGGAVEKTPEPPKGSPASPVDERASRAEQPRPIRFAYPEDDALVAAAVAQGATVRPYGPDGVAVQVDLRSLHTAGLVRPASADAFAGDRLGGVMLGRRPQSAPGRSSKRPQSARASLPSAATPGRIYSARPVRVRGGRAHVAARCATMSVSGEPLQVCTKPKPPSTQFRAQ